MSALAAGQLISERYQLDRRIAVGGMGEVWEAQDTRLGRSVAVKVLKADLSDDPEFLHRFRIEARTVASLDHSGIASVHDYGEDDGPAGGGRTAYLVMELVRGEPLSSRISRGAIPPHETLDIIEQAARALQAAHERGFVHRDVKPGNILLRTDGVVKLTDFGIAKAADAVPVTRSGMVMGTAHYIAPEQASGDEAGPAGDVYSLGVVGYECLAGQRPFRAESAVAVAMMQVRDDPPPLPAEIPERIRGLISSVLVKDPEQRYADGAEFAAAVAAVRRGQQPPPAGADPEAGNAVSSTTPAPASPPDRSGGPARPAGPPPQAPPAHGAAPPTPLPHDPGPPSAPRHRAVDPASRPAAGPPTPAPGRYASGPVPVRPMTPPPGAPPPYRGPDGRPAEAPRRPAPPARPPLRAEPPGADAGPADAMRADATQADAGRADATRAEQARAESSPGTEHPSGPLDFSPRRSGRSRALLAALFVILTIAAVLLAVLILRGTSIAAVTSGSVTGPTGTVSGWEAERTGPAAPSGPSVVDRAEAGVR